MEIALQAATNFLFTALGGVLVYVTNKWNLTHGEELKSQSAKVELRRSKLERAHILLGNIVEYYDAHIFGSYIPARYPTDELNELILLVRVYSDSCSDSLDNVLNKKSEISEIILKRSGEHSDDGKADNQIPMPEIINEFRNINGNLRELGTALRAELRSTL